MVPRSRSRNSAEKRQRRAERAMMYRHVRDQTFLVFRQHGNARKGSPPNALACHSRYVRAPL